MGRWLLLGLVVCSGCPSEDTAKVDTGPSWTDDGCGDARGRASIWDCAVVDSDCDGYDSDEDCDEDNASINPGATEICDNVDNDCDGDVDEGVTATYYADADHDGYGAPDAQAESCSTPPGYVPTATDCDDAHAEAYPGHAEDCDGLDNNCDGEVDEGLIQTWYVDDDGDGYGDPDAATEVCADPGAPYVDNGADCDDASAAVSPDAAEVCDGVDNNCDTQVDEPFLSTDFDASLPADLALNADADWRSDAGDGFVRLTDTDDGSDPLYDQTGSLMYTALIAADRWKVSFTASISGGVGVTRPDGRVGTGGDGLAFVVLEGADDTYLGEGGEYLGYYDTTATGYAVELDTYCNADLGTSDCYYIYSDYGDPSDNHLALVDVATMEHLASDSDLPTLEDGGEFTVTVTYELGTLVATLSDGLGAYTVRQDVALSGEVRVGFTGATGWEVGRHDLDDLEIGCP